MRNSFVFSREKLPILEEEKYNILQVKYIYI